MNSVKEKAPSTAATVQSAETKYQIQNNTSQEDCKAFPHGRIYTEAEVNAELDNLADEREIPALTRKIFIVLGKHGLLDAFCEVVLDMPDDYESDPEGYFKRAIAEAYRRVSA